MSNFSEIVKALSDDKSVCRKTWAEGSYMYADKNGQLMRSKRSAGGIVSRSYAWVLDMKDILATDWSTLN